MGRYLGQEVERVAVGPLSAYSQMPLEFYVSIGSGTPTNTIEFVPQTVATRASAKNRAPTA